MPQGSASLAVDSRDNIHVVWDGFGWGTNPGAINVEYRMRSSLGWQPQEAVTDRNVTQGRPSIAVDSKDFVHVVWEGLGWGTNTGFGNIEYRMRSLAGWQAVEGVTDMNVNQLEASIAMDFMDNVHVVWFGMGWGTNITHSNVEYRMRSSSGWQMVVGLTDSALAQLFPILIWAEWPDPPMVRTDVPRRGYALVYSGQDASGWKVVYLASSDLTWGVKPWIAVGGTVEPVSTGLLVPYLTVASLLIAMSSVYVFRRRTRTSV